MKRNFYGCLAVIICSGLQIGTVLKSEDPIGDTQTSPIKYEDKMEEVKDGEKGAPTPSFKFYDKAEFLVDPPMTNEAGEESLKSGLDNLEAPGGKHYEDFTWEDIDDGWWFEDDQPEVKKKGDLDVLNDLG